MEKLKIVPTMNKKQTNTLMKIHKIYHNKMSKHVPKKCPISTQEYHKIYKNIPNIFQNYKCTRKKNPPHYTQNDIKKNLSHPKSTHKKTKNTLKIHQNYLKTLTNIP